MTADEANAYFAGIGYEPVYNQEEIPDATVSTSAEILPEIFEYDRFNTAVANAVLAPLVSGYVNRLADQLRDGGYKGDLLLLHSGGGSMTPRLVEKFPVRLAASGMARPAAGLTAGGTGWLAGA